MIERIGQWLKLIPTTIQPYDPEKDDVKGKNGDSTATHPVVKDGDLEFLFYQLLEGVANGWQESRIEQFFEKLEPRISLETWLDWLQRYRNQLIKSSHGHSQLAVRMIRLGELTATLPFMRGVGDLAYEIGKELLNQIKNNNFVNSFNSHHQENIDKNIDKIEDKTPINEVTESLTAKIDSPTSLGELLSLLQKDENFASEIAHQLNLNTVDPSVIIAKIVEQTESDSLPIFSGSISEELVEYLFNLGLEKASAGDFEEALISWNQAVTLNPDFAPAWHNKGSALAYLNRLPEAVQSFEQAIALNVNDLDSWYDRGSALFSMGQWQEAIISWERVIGIQPNHYQAWYHRGLALEKLKKLGDALNSYGKCLSINPLFTPAQKRQEKLNFLLSSNSEN